MKEIIILVDKNDKQIGTIEKIEAHEKALLHRAFSIFIFDSSGKMLIHQRAKGKYHCAGLWTNACCSHPWPGETTEKGAHRKLKQEMSFDTKLKKIFSFIYKAPFGNGLTEHEFDHVFIGKFDGKFKPNPKEVCNFKFVAIPELLQDVKNHPDNYTPWFKIILKKVIKHVKNQY